MTKRGFQLIIKRWDSVYISCILFTHLTSMHLHNINNYTWKKCLVKTLHGIHLQRLSLLVLIFLHFVLHVIFTFNWTIFCCFQTLAKTKWTKTGVKVFRKLVFCYVQMFTFKLKNLTSCYALNKIFAAIFPRVQFGTRTINWRFHHEWFRIFKLHFCRYPVGRLTG